MREVNSLDIILRILGIIVLALSATLGAGGRQPGDGESTTSPGRPPIVMATPTPGQGGATPVTAVPHIINAVEVFVLESFPPQISLGVIGYQPDGCTFPVQVTQVRDGNTITVSIFRELPPDVICTMQIVEYQNTIKLDGTFDPGTYIIIVNNQTVTVTI